MTTAPDMAASIAPKSDQQNYDDYLAGPRTVTIEKATKGSAEQPVDIHLVEFPGRAYRPSKSMRRVLVHAWGTDTSVYVGRRMRLYGDPDVKFGGEKVGGIKISHLSHIKQRITVQLTATRGKRAPFTVDPLPETPAAISAEAATEFAQRIAEATTTSDLETIARDLKACDLGTHRAHLLNAWKDRRNTITETPPGQDGGNDASEGAAVQSADLRPDSHDQEPPAPKTATRQQLTQLKTIRQAEKWDADAEWFAYVQNITGVEVTADSQLTDEQAQRIIDLFNEESNQ